MDDRTSGTSPQAATTASTPTATAPQATATTPQPGVVTDPVVTEPGATTGVQGGATAPPESQPGGAGDEEGIRVPVELKVSADAVSPATVTVPAFLPLEITARSGDGQAHRVQVVGASLAVPASGSASATVDGQRRGTYPVTVDGRSLGELVVGDEPGP